MRKYLQYINEDARFEQDIKTTTKLKIVSASQMYFHFKDQMVFGNARKNFKFMLK